MNGKKRERRKATRRVFLGGLAAGAGYIAATRVRTDGQRFVGGPVGSGSGGEVTIMPGVIQEQYYYPTIEEFEANEPEPEQYPALVMTDEGAWVYDDA